MRTYGEEENVGKPKNYKLITVGVLDESSKVKLSQLDPVSAIRPDPNATIPVG